MPFSGDPGPAPSILLHGGEPGVLLRCAEALADFFPRALLSLPADDSEALTLVSLRRYQLTLLGTQLSQHGELLRQLTVADEFPRILSLHPPETSPDLGLPLQVHYLPSGALPGEIALQAAAMLGVPEPVWNAPWSVALRVIASEFLTLRVNLRGRDGLSGNFCFVRGRIVSSQVRDRSGRSFTAGDLLYVSGLEFQSHRTHSVLRSPAVHGLHSTRPGGWAPAAESTIFPTRPPVGPPAPAPSSSRLTVCLVEGDPRMRSSVRQMVEDTPDLHLLETYATAEEALGGLLLQKPMVTLVNLQLPGLSGVQLISRVVGYLPQTSFLGLASPDDDRHAAEFLRQGGTGLVPDFELATHLPAHIRAVASQRTTPLSPGIARKLLRFFALPHPQANASLARLGQGDEDLLTALAKGRRLSEIAAELGRTEDALSRQLRLIVWRFSATASAQSKADALTNGRSALRVPERVVDLDFYDPAARATG